MGSDKLVYTPYELEQVLGLSRSSVYQGIASGEIPHIRVGNRILIPKKLLDEWLSGKQVRAEVNAS